MIDSVFVTCLRCCHVVVASGFFGVPFFTPVVPFFTPVVAILIQHTRNETNKAPQARFEVCSTRLFTMTCLVAIRLFGS